jgi:hypothetical protein
MSEMSESGLSSGNFLRVFVRGCPLRATALPAATEVKRLITWPDRPGQGTGAPGDRNTAGGHGGATGTRWMPFGECGSGNVYFRPGQFGEQPWGSIVLGAARPCAMW